jgi:ABC-type branched-subunit amino acid transport system ATPase component
VAVGSLDVKDLRVTFGGLVAVDGATLSAPTGRITGLIGPNGAGKTTVFNACSGLNSPAAGSVSLNDASLARRGPASRARRGLGRTFQQMELFDSLTVWDNVALGHEGGRAGVNPLSHLASTPGTAREIGQVTADALRQCDLLGLADRTVGSLSTGQRRLVELARCLAGDFQILLLDEPSSGLDRTETVRFGEILRDVVQERGIGILLVEHDMALVTEVCDYIYVLDFGKLIHQGVAGDVVASKVVQAAYLGGEDLDEELDQLELQVMENAR